MITVIGSINLDLIARVERLPEPGETVSGDSFTTTPGGKGANQALAARRAGGLVRIIGAVGQGNFADEALSPVRDAGVDLSGVHETHSATGTAVILVAADGENVIAVIPGSNASVRPGDVAVAEIARDEILLLQLEVPLETVEAALDAGDRAGAVTILNAAPFKAEAVPLLRKADHVVVNESEFDRYAEALDLAGTTREDRMRAFVADTGHSLVVTLGKEGLLAATPEDFHELPAMQIEPVDTVGAGDTFCGYLAAGIEARLPLTDALAQAGTAGALACLKPGAQPAVPSRAEVDAALADRIAKDSDA